MNFFLEYFYFLILLVTSFKLNSILVKETAGVVCQDIKKNPLSDCLIKE